MNPDSDNYKFPTIDVPVFADDGRRIHRIRQSSLKDVDICLERARLKMLGSLPRIESDSTAMGTAVHTGLELTLLEQIGTRVPLSLSAANEAAQQHFSELLLSPEGFVWNKTKEGGARAFISDALGAWYREVLPTLQPLEVEVAFGPLVLFEDSERIIEVVGTIDYVDAMGLMDWKTSLGKGWEKWETERWDLQSAVYTWAADQMGYPLSVAGKCSFEFVIMKRKRLGEVEIQRIKVWRHEGHFDWLKERVLALVKLIEADIAPWPLNDNSALCSPTYCPAWDACKGMYFGKVNGVGWPKVDVPAEVA